MLAESTHIRLYPTVFTILSYIHLKPAQTRKPVSQFPPCLCFKKNNQMKTQTKPHIDLEQRVLPIKENINTMVEVAWQLTLNSLWPHMDDAVMDKQHVKKIIRKRITGDDPYKAYLQFCERILLCWKVIAEEYAFGQTETPIDWFDPKNLNGFKASEIFYKMFKKSRQRNPSAYQELSALAEAILEMAEVPLRANFNYWKNWFAENYYYDEYVLFYMCCVRNSNSFKK